MVSLSSEIIYKYFNELSKHQKDQIDGLGGLYREWNDKINVISRKDIDNLYMHHVLHSLSIAKYMQFSDKAKVIDIGTGGGFPGVPLAILFPETQFVLLDSTRKKLKVIEEVIEALQIENITTVHQRVEEHKASYHFVITRAMANMTLLYRFAQKLVKKTHVQGVPNGLIALKGGHLKSELKEARIKHADVVNISDYFEEPFFETKQLVYVQI